MMELLGRADPAAGLEADAARLRAKVDERIGIASPLGAPKRAGRWWLVAAAGFAAVAVVFLPFLLLRGDDQSAFVPGDAFRDLPGVESIVHAGSARTMVADGDVIWVADPFSGELHRLEARTAAIEATYAIGEPVAAAAVGGGFVWLASEDDGGEVLRFDEEEGAVDLTIPIGSWPTIGWAGDDLWVSSDDGVLRRFSADGEARSTGRGQVMGVGPEGVWILDPDGGELVGLTADGSPRGLTVPTDGLPILQVLELDGFLWMIDEDWSVYRSDLSGEQPTWAERAGLGPRSLIAFDGSIWIISFWDHLLTRIDASTAEVLSVTPLGGRPGDLVAADGSLWVGLNHPSAVLRLDPEADLLDVGALVVDEVVDGYRFICTGSGNGPTILLDGFAWIGHGSWSVIQAELAREHRVCAHGYFDGDRDPVAKAENLTASLARFGIDGPYLLVANGDGVHSTRLFAEDRDDIAGVVLVDPMPVGFPGFYDEATGRLEGNGHPEWVDLEPDVAASLGGLGDIPLVVIGQDPEAVYLSPQFVAYAGRELAEQIDAYWQEGLASYAGLSSDSSTVTADGAGMQGILWDRSRLIVEAIQAVIAEGGGG